MKRSMVSSFGKLRACSSTPSSMIWKIPPNWCRFYSIVSTIRLFGGPGALREAEKVMSQIGAAYFAPKKDVHLFAEIAPAGELDPLFAFSAACRKELQAHGKGNP